MNGTKLSISLIGSPLRDSQGNIIAALTIMRDITEMKKAEERAFLDKLTGFINRKPFEKLLEQTLAESKTRNERCGLLFIALNIKNNYPSIKPHIKNKLILKSVNKIRKFVKSPNPHR